MERFYLMVQQFQIIRSNSFQYLQRDQRRRNIIPIQYLHQVVWIMQIRKQHLRLVYGNGHRGQTRVLPCFDLLTGSFHHIKIQFQTKSIFLKERDKFIWIAVRAVWILPAHQSFCPHQTFIFHAKLRL